MLSAFVPGSPGSGNKAVSSQFQNDYFINQIGLTLDPRYVNKTGDVMSGSLVVNNKIESNSTICINGNCRTTFTPQNCPTGQVLKSINSDGTIVCSNVTCPDSSTFFVGINASGGPICKAFPTNTCSANQYVSVVNADGSVGCSNLPSGANKDCSPGAIQRIDSAGNHYCTSTLPNDKNVYAKTCPTNETIKGIDSLGNLICTADKAVYGQQCAPGESLRGFDASGVIICEATSGWPLGSYCIFRNGGSCPIGFATDEIHLVIGGHGHDMCPGDERAGDSTFIGAGVCTVRVKMCCK